MLAAAAACVPVLIIAYAVITSHSGRAVDTADVTGAGLQPTYGHGARAGGWGKGGSASQTFSSFWVGLDGDGTSTVEQTGTEADCANGAASYQGWFEMFPAAPVFFGNTVQPGDAMSAPVVAGGSVSFTLTLTDSTQHWSKVTQQTSTTAQLGSAEIIAEAPSDGNGVLPLSDFGAVTFTDALIDNDAIGSLNTAAVTMESASNVAEATPSALANGDEFTVTADNGGASTTGAGGGTGTTGSHRHDHHRNELGG